MKDTFMNADSVFLDVLKGAAILALAPVAISLLIVALKLFRVYRTDRGEYTRNRDRSPSLLKVMRGETPTFYDGFRDERVAAGIARDLKTNRWVEQGKLSEEAISNVLR